MILKDIDIAFINEAVELANYNYLLELEHVNEIQTINQKDKLYSTLQKLFNKNLGSMIFDDENVLIGYLAFNGIHNTHNKKIKKSYSPIHGYGIKEGYERSKVMSLLFQNASQKLVKKEVGSFELKVYAHDIEVITTYVLNQFGIQCTDTIKYVEDSICENTQSNIKCLELSTDEIYNNKQTLLAMWDRLRKHLQKSPTYYPGIEFTDEVYWEHINHPETRVFVASDDKQIIGILDASKDGNCFINSDEETINIGDLFILERYRGQNVAQELLQFANDTLKKDGYKCLWVEHGTTNPNAIGFWDKYFKRFTYTLTREIDERIINYMTQKKELKGDK